MTCFPSRLDGVIPLAVELVALDGEGLHLLLCDLATGRVAVLVQLRPDRQPSLRRRVADQIHYDLLAHQWLTTPVLRDVAAYPMLDRVPLTVRSFLLGF